MIFVCFQVFTNPDEEGANKIFDNGTQENNFCSLYNKVVPISIGIE